MVVSRITECMSENGHGIIDWITKCRKEITVLLIVKVMVRMMVKLLVRNPHEK
jgi:hypothetical protein